MDQKLKLHPDHQVHDGTYDPMTGRLVLQLNGGVYAYHSVHPDKKEGLEQAENHGKYFHEHIKKQHKFSRVR